MKNKFILVIIITFFTVHLISIDQNAGTSGFSFLKLQFSARAAGMANAFTGLSNDTDAVFYNTAGLAKNTHQHIKINYINYIDGMDGGSLSFTKKIDAIWSIAPFIQFMVSDDIPETIERNEQYGGVIGSFNTSHIICGIGFARELNEVVDFGINVKYFYEKLYDNNTATVLAFDFSVLHQTNNPDLKIGATIKNIGTQLAYYTETKHKEKMPVTAIVGASYLVIDKGVVNLDICRPFDNDFYGKLGIEYYLNNFLSIRTGLDTRIQDYKTNANSDLLSGISFGLGISRDKYLVDYAVSSMGSFGYINQISMGYNF